MNKKKVITIGAILLVAALVICAFALSKKDDSQNDLPDNDNIIISGDSAVSGESTPYVDTSISETLPIEGTEEFNGLTITNFEVQMIGSRQCEIRGDVTNNTEEYIEGQNMRLTSYDADGNVIDIFGAQVEGVFPGKTTKFYAMIRRADLPQIASIKIEANK